jgi:hypothetical protein
MWSTALQQVREVVWLMTMLTGLSLISLAVAASALAIAEMRLASLMPLLSASLS